MHHPNVTSQLTRYLPSFRGPLRTLEISNSPSNVWVLSRVNFGGEEGPESDAEAELLTSRGEGRSFFVAVRFLVAARFGWLRGDGVTSVSSVLDARFFVAARFGWLRGGGTA